MTKNIKPSPDNLPDGFQLVPRGSIFESTHTGFSIHVDRQPFELEDYPHGPYYTASGAAEALGNVVTASTIRSWLKENITSFGFVMGAEKFGKHFIVPAEKVESLKEILSDQALLDEIIAGGKTKDIHIKRAIPVENGDKVSDYMSIKEAREALEGVYPDLPRWIQNGESGFGTPFEARLINNRVMLPKAQVMEVRRLKDSGKYIYDRGRYVLDREAITSTPG